MFCAMWSGDLLHNGAWVDFSSLEILVWRASRAADTLAFGSRWERAKRLVLDRGPQPREQQDIWLSAGNRWSHMPRRTIA